MIAAVMEDEGWWWCPLLVKHEMTTGWQPDGKGIRTAHWCSVNPRLACSWHLYLLRSHIQGCRRLTLLSCCHTAARTSAFWSTSLGVCVKRRERGTSCKGSVGSKMKWIKVWSYYSLWKVDINPEDNHQDDCSWNKNGKGDIGSLHAIIHINNWKEKHRKKRHYFLLLCTQKKYQYIDIAMSQNMTHHLACVHSHIGPRTLQRHNGRLVSIWTGVV